MRIKPTQEKSRQNKSLAKSHSHEKQNPQLRRVTRGSAVSFPLFLLCFVSFSLGIFCVCLQFAKPVLGRNRGPFYLFRFHLKCDENEQNSEMFEVTFDNKW